MKSYSFQRYLSAKKTVDDRALNQPVWQALAARIKPGMRVIEIGAGTGAMLERMLKWKLLTSGDYTGIDAEVENITQALYNLPEWAAENGYLYQPIGTGGYSLTQGERSITARFEAIDVFEFIQREQHQRIAGWDVLMAHAFLDLVDISTALPRLLTLLKPDGLCYFSINFDGLTVLEPIIEPHLDEQIQALYHRTMDVRTVQGLPSGDSRSGRHMFGHLKDASVEIIQAGASDWVVWPSNRQQTGSPLVYPADEAYFLHFIIDTIHTALQGNSELDPERFEAWIAERHVQIERGELVYIAHQMDFLGVNKR